MNAGVIGGTIGCIIGIVGGIIGTYCSIKNTAGPLERAYMVKVSVVTWITILVFLVLMYMLPNPYRFWLWVPYGVLLPLGITRINRTVAKIRETEHADDSKGHTLTGR